MAEPTQQTVSLTGNLGIVVNIVNWFLAFAVSLFLGTRFGMKLIRHLKLGVDDLIIFMSTVLSFGLVATVTIQTANGLGRHVTSLSSVQLDLYQKSDYASQIFYILSLTLSKISVMLLLSFITPVELHTAFLFGLGAFTITWGSTALLVIIFQCHVPDVWKTLGSQCINQTSFWTYFGVCNILGEVALIALPAYIMRDVHMAQSSKAVVITCFAMRLLVIGGILPELIFRQRMSGSTDQTFDSWPVVVSLLCVQSLSIITASIPYLKPFFANLESGMMRTDDLRRLEGRRTITDTSRNIANQIWSRSKKSKQSDDSTSTSLGLTPWQKSTNTPSGLEAVTRVVAGENGVLAAKSDADSQTSRSRFIHQTTTWEVSDVLSPT